MLWWDICCFGAALGCAVVITLPPWAMRFGVLPKSGWLIATLVCAALGCTH